MIGLKDVVGQREPDFRNFLKILKGQKPERHTLFEFFLNPQVYREVTNRELSDDTAQEKAKWVLETYYKLGYDCFSLYASSFGFPRNAAAQRLASISLNEGGEITDAESYRSFPWQEPSEYYDGLLERLEPYLPDGMKFIVYGPGGVLENAISLVGYDALCLMLYDDPALTEAIFYQIGSRLVEYYRIIAHYDCVGAIICNDDWGFKTQTMLAPDDLRKYVFPYHKQCVEIAHAAGKPAILHSCGNLELVYDDIINDMKYDGKHSYEDSIMPVEQAYDELYGKIAVIGGIDVDFICRSDQESIIRRCRTMLEKTGGAGYALGTGNSIPEYVPKENYYAMIYAAISK